MEKLKEAWLNLVKNANEKGVPLPLVRAGGQASLSATLVFLSFNTWLISVIGKAAGALGGMDPSQCLNMFVVCTGLYFGRKFQKGSDGAISVEEDPTKALEKKYEGQQ